MPQLGSHRGRWRVSGADATIEINALGALPAVIDLVIEATEAGELDQVPEVVGSTPSGSTKLNKGLARNG